MNDPQAPDSSLGTSLQTVRFSQEIPVGPFLQLGIRRYLYRPTFLIVFGIASLFLFLRGGDTFQSLDKGWLIYFVALLLVMSGFHLLSLWYMVRGNLLLRGPQDVTFDPTGLTIAGEGYRMFLTWAVIDHARVYRNWLLLYTDRNSATYVYLPAIDHVGDRAILLALCRAELGSKISPSK